MSELERLVAEVAETANSIRVKDLVRMLLVATVLVVMVLLLVG